MIMGKEFLHQRPGQHKSYPGWQEPGLWRCRWVMDREFQSADSSKSHRDRLYIKLKPDRTVQIFTSAKRPWFQFGKQQAVQSDTEVKKNIFEQNTEQNDKTSTIMKADNLSDVEGTWSFEDENPFPTAKVIIETRERESDGVVSRIRHECRCEWGKQDEYAAKFHIDKIFKYKGFNTGSGRGSSTMAGAVADMPIGKYPVGSCLLRANVQRPLLSKDFLAFQ